MTRPSTARETAPRIYCIPATQAPIVAVLRRGPSEWAHVGRWDLSQPRFEPGAWLRGRLFPRRSDLSPDGTLLCAFVHKPGATWEHGETYVSVSKLPWLTALEAFGTCGTWTRGYHFTTDTGEATERLAIDPRYRIRAAAAVQFATERRRGWVEADDCPPRKPNDTWDQHRNAHMCKTQPGGDSRLYVESLGWAGGELGIDGAIDGLRVQYSLAFSSGSNASLQPLHDLQWADWDDSGRLLAATRSGRLQIRTATPPHVEITFEADLAGDTPDPRPAPPWAREWPPARGG